MKCAVDYCIYNKDFKCLLDITNINALGMCDECIILSLDKDFLETMKNQQLQKMEKRCAGCATRTKKILVKNHKLFAYKDPFSNPIKKPPPPYI